VAETPRGARRRALGAGQVAAVGITLLETYAHLRLKDELPALFRQWEDDG
jgi:hypothetical protein